MVPLRWRPRDRLRTGCHIEARDLQLVLQRHEPYIEQMLDFYERRAADYDGWANGVHGRAAEKLAALAAPAAAETWLDIACGTGLALRSVRRSPRAKLCIGVDVSRPMLDIAMAQEPAPRRRLVPMDAHSLGLASRSFDVVTIGQGLAYMVDPDTALAEAHRVLRHGGRIAVSCQRRRLDTPAQRIFFSHLRRMAALHPVRMPRLSADRAVFGEPRVLREVLAGAGFEDTRITQMVVGQRATDAHEYTTLMRGAGPHTHALISVLGPRLLRDFEQRLAEMMDDLGEGAYRYHHAFTFAVAVRP